MTAASYKTADGRSYPTKCFPARTLLHRRREGAGHWLVAYRKAEEQKYRNVLRRIKEKDRGVDAPHGKTLDGPFLLHLHCVDKPSELCSVDISEQKLNSVKPEDLKVFDNVAYIDASINFLSLESFSSFVSLRELNLSLNGLCDMTFHAADFPHLQLLSHLQLFHKGRALISTGVKKRNHVLDLSYNGLSAGDIVSIGQLQRLKVLHLTGNQLHHLPPNLGSSNHDATELPAKEEDTQFKALEVLVLDDNKLSSGVFNSLTNLKRLKYLNLQANCISEIPYLQLTDNSKPLQTSIEEPAEENGLVSTEPAPNTDEHVKRISQIFHKDSWEECCKGSSLPLPELQFLNLADNKIAGEEALMAAALFPKLQEIDIHSNPLTTQRGRNPPLLTHYLQERLGITIKRKKTQEVVKLPLKVSTGPKWKGEKSELTVKRTSESEGKNGIQENTDFRLHFFVTQKTDVPEYKSDLQADEKETAENEERNKHDTLPEKCTFYEMLMDAKPNPDVVEPIGIQTAVRMLEHTLKNLNVYRDSKPKLDCIQTRDREREKKVKELPPFKPIKHPADRVDEMIKEIKESTTMREVPLSSAMHSTGVTKQEALSLLRDLKTKYKMVHKRTMELAASIESDRNGNQNGAETPPARTL